LSSATVVSPLRHEGSRTLSRGISVLRAIGEHPDGVTVSGISNQTGLDRAVIYRLLDTLLEEGFVDRGTDGRIYRMGLSMLELGVMASRSIEVRQLAGPSLQTLTDTTQATASLAVRDRDTLVVVSVVGPEQDTSDFYYHLGFRHQLGVAAHGKALLAFLPEGAAHPTLLQVRQRGVAFTRDELCPGVSSIASPVFDQSGSAVAAVGVVAPSEQLADADRVAIEVLRSARQISETLGWRPRRAV
jgi:DNA-binding IclR family transcriptional regulator